MCKEDDLLCAPGSTGPLCSGCIDGYTFNSALAVCVFCESSANTAPIMFMGGIALVVAVAVFLRLRGYELPACVARVPCVALFAHVDMGTCKVLWSTMQIVSGIQWNLNVIFPKPFAGFLSLLSFFQLDFLTLDCVSGENSFYAKVYVTQFFPIVIVALIAFVGVLRIIVSHVWSRSSPADSPQINTYHDGIVNQHVYAALLVTYIVLPTVASLQFKAMDCVTMHHDGSSFLRVDSAIDCDSEEYEDFSNVVILGIIGTEHAHIIDTSPVPQKLRTTRTDLLPFAFANVQNKTNKREQI